MIHGRGLVGFGVLLALPTVAIPVAADDPVTVVRQFFEARNRYAAAAAAPLVSDDIRFVGGPNCAPVNPCLGPAGVRAEIESNFTRNHARNIIVGTPQVTGTTVVIRTEAYSDVFSALGFERTVVITTIDVREGKIAMYNGVFDMSDPQTAQYLAAQRAPQGRPTSPLTPPGTGWGSASSIIRRLGDG